MQRQFTTHLFGWSLDFRSIQLCTALRIDPVWLGRLRVNFVILQESLSKLSYSNHPPIFSSNSLYPPDTCPSLFTLWRQSLTSVPTSSSLSYPSFGSQSHVRSFPISSQHKTAADGYLCIHQALQISHSRVSVDESR